MSVDGWNTLLVLGGIRSGKSEFAETLVRDTARVRYLATAASRTEDPEWSARIERHQGRRPETWSTEEIDANPSRLAQLIAAARPDETLLVDDLGGWVSILLDPAHQPADDVATIDELATAVRDCAARLVLVSPEVGLSLVPLTPLGRAFTDALGSTNQVIADACDAAVLVVAGQPSWLKPTAPATARTVLPAQNTGSARASGGGTEAGRANGASGLTDTAGDNTVNRDDQGDRDNQGALDSRTGEVIAPAGRAAVAVPTFAPRMDLPLPDEGVGQAALDRLNTLDFPGAGIGHLDRIVRFAATVQGVPTPTPWRSVRVLLIQGDHDGGAAAGTPAGEATRQAELARAGAGPLAGLASEAGATLQVVPAPTAAPIEDGPALTAEAVEAALRHGWQLVARAAEDGVELIVLGACGAGAETAAVAVLAATTGAEPAAVLGRVVRGDRVDDTAWMTRCAAVRDALRRTRHLSREGKELLGELAGGDIALATGVLIAAAAHRLPVLVDGPVGIAAGLVSRDLGGQARHWCLLPDHGGHPGVRFGADVLDLAPLLDLRLDLGEGAGALVALAPLRAALTLAATTPVRPDPTPEPDTVPAPDSGPETLSNPEPDPDPTPEPEPEPDPTPTGEPAEGGREPASDGEEFAEPQPAGPGPTRGAGAGG